jgi:hypothetical protein
MRDIVISYGYCIACNLPFAFNRFRVPKIWAHGRRGPVCRHCVNHMNEIRIAAGLELVIPLPDAYEPDMRARAQ